MSENLFKLRLKEVMDEQNINQKELCERTGIPKSAMSQYCNGYMLPKTDRLYMISSVFNVNPTWLMGLDVPKDNNSLDTNAFYQPDFVFDHLGLFIETKNTKNYLVKLANGISNLDPANRKEFYNIYLDACDKVELTYIHKYINFLRAKNELQDISTITKENI